MASTVGTENTNKFKQLVKISTIDPKEYKASVDDSTKRYFCGKGHYWTIDRRNERTPPKFSIDFEDKNGDRVESVFIDQKIYACRICMVLRNISMFTRKCVAISSDCDSSEYIFKCPKGHMFGIHNPFENRHNFECPCCGIEKLLLNQIEFYKHGVHYDQFTVLRFHCHVCKMDDFSTTKFLKKHGARHHHHVDGEIDDRHVMITTRMAFEHLLSIPCDGQIEQIQRGQPECYSEELKIAVVHMHRHRSRIAAEALVRIQDYCDDNNIDLFKIPKTMFRETDMIRYLIRCLIDTGRYDGKSQDALVVALTNRDILFSNNHQFKRYSDYDDDDDE